MSSSTRTFLEPTVSGHDSYVRVDINSGWISLKIADCDRNITLGFNPEKPKMALRKLKKLEDALAEIRAELEAQ